MDTSPSAPATRPEASHRPVVCAAALIVLAVLLIYANSLAGPFVFDDVPSIRDNPAIRHLWPPGLLLSPSAIQGLTTNGRPVVTLSLALNYALGGTAVWSYHVANLLIHVLAALTLMGVARRTLERTGKSPLEAHALGFAIALLWAAHPLQTAAVTYVVQRAESLMGLSYLLTLYCFIRYTEGESSFAGGAAQKAAGRGKWAVLSVLACLCGMATKEVMVTAPVMALLYDRTFVSGSFRAAWQRHRRAHLGLASTWLLLAVLMAAAGNRGGTAGFGTSVAWWRYALSQSPAIVRYLRLSLWPSPLVFDYGVDLAARPEQVALAMAVVALLLVGTAHAFLSDPKRGLGRRALGYAGVWCLGILAPTSSFVPVATQTMAEHRMYLPLASVVAVTVCAIHAFLQWSLGRDGGIGRPIRVLLGSSFAAAAVLGIASAKRNADYRSELALWSDTVAKRPENADAQYNLGRLLKQDGRTAEAAAHYMEAVRLRPDFALAHNNLALALSQLGRTQEALMHGEEAARLQPGSASIQSNLGNILYRSGRVNEAIALYRESLRLRPNFAEAHNDLGVALARSGASAEAMRHFQAAVRLKPDFSEAYYNWGNALADARLSDEASRCYAAAIALRPEFPEAYFNWGITLAEAGKTTEAVRCFENALRLRPDFDAARKNLLLLRPSERH